MQTTVLLERAPVSKEGLLLVQTRPHREPVPLLGDSPEGEHRQVETGADGGRGVRWGGPLGHEARQVGQPPALQEDVGCQGTCCYVAPKHHSGETPLRLLPWVCSVEAAGVGVGGGLW